MKARLIDLEKDYPELGGWFKSHQGYAIPTNILPKLGIVVESNCGMSAAGWLYMDNSVGVAWPAWMVTNPNISPIIAGRALEHVLEALEVCAKQHDYGVFFTMAKQPSLIKWLKKRGFVQNHADMVQLFKVFHHGN